MGHPKSSWAACPCMGLPWVGPGILMSCTRRVYTCQLSSTQVEPSFSQHQQAPIIEVNDDPSQRQAENPHQVDQDGSSRLDYPVSTLTGLSSPMQSIAEGRFIESTSRSSQHLSRSMPDQDQDQHV